MFFLVKGLSQRPRVECQGFKNFLIYWLIYFFAYLKFVIISFLVSSGRKISLLSPSVSNTRMLALVFSLQHFLAFSYFTCACFSELFVMEGFLSAFSLLSNLCWKSFNISIKKTFSFAQRMLLKILPKVKRRLHEPLYNVVLGRKNDILCPSNSKSMIKYLDILSPLGSKEETHEWLREKSREFCDHKIQKMFFSNYKYVI